MARIKLSIPDHFEFSCTIPIRITDINYGGHVGNDTILSLMHEARIRYFQHLGYSEMNFAGTGMIMSDVAIEFKSELFYGDTVIASVGAGDFSRVGFDVLYRFEKETDGKRKTVALAKTGMVCFDYTQKKIVTVPEAAKMKMLPSIS